MAEMLVPVMVDSSAAVRAAWSVDGLVGDLDGGSVGNSADESADEMVAY